jgi:hypothetical protein
MNILENLKLSGHSTTSLELHVHEARKGVSSIRIENDDIGTALIQVNDGKSAATMRLKNDTLACLYKALEQYFLHEYRPMSKGQKASEEE